MSTTVPHIDNVRPELMVLAALAISVKFLDDTQWSTRYWINCVSERRWTFEQLNVTQACMMENLKYRIHPLWTEECIQEALADMESAGKTVRRRSIAMLGHNNMANRVVDGASTLLDKNMSLTPESQPVAEKVVIKNIYEVAFSGPGIDLDEFPAYAEPVFEFEPF